MSDELQSSPEVEYDGLVWLPLKTELAVSKLCPVCRQVVHAITRNDWADGPELVIEPCRCRLKAVRKIKQDWD